jgi:hypothetical protein
VLLSKRLFPGPHGMILQGDGPGPPPFNLDANLPLSHFRVDLGNGIAHNMRLPVPWGLFQT